MINIEVSEHSVFSYDAKRLTISLWDHSQGWLSGEVSGEIGSIKFHNRQQLEMFTEMAQFILDETTLRSD